VIIVVLLIRPIFSYLCGVCVFLVCFTEFTSVQSVTYTTYGMDECSKVRRLRERRCRNSLLNNINHQTATHDRLIL